MDESFRIYIDRLREGQKQEIKEKIDPKFLNISDEEVKFENPVEVTGEAYIATDHLVVHLQASTEALVPCSICNAWVPVDIELEELYLTEPLTEIRSGIYSYEEPLREEILLEVPQFAECNQGQCDQRKDLEKYLRQPGKDEEEEGYQPFKDL